MSALHRLKERVPAPAGQSSSYIIRGGLEGRERLGVLARVMRPTTLAFLLRAGLREGMRCIDIGCGGGDVTADLARIVGPRGRVLGIDLDEVKLEIARAEAASAGLSNVAFCAGDALAGDAPVPEFDAVYARFLLTHLREPERAVARMRDLLRPGGVLIVEDIDVRGYFADPPSWAATAYFDLYRRTAQARGADPDIGPRVPGMLEAAGIAPAAMTIVQPAGLRGEVKLINGLTMEAIADAVVAAGFASRERTERIIDKLYRLARDETTVMGMPRIVQTWGCKP